jgi:putative restriction endonuclease
MRYWWVNQNQTYNQEFSGGYLWSPKRNNNGARNSFYDSMRELAPGDLIFSFNKTYIPSIGIAQSNCYECPKPLEFGLTGMNWEKIGWKVNVKYHSLISIVRPRDHMGIIGPLLPARYAPLQKNGNGLQGVYLTELNFALAGILVSLVGHEAKVLVQGNHLDDARGNLSADTSGLLEWENHLRHEVESDETMTETEKLTLIASRIGQGKFKDNVKRIESRCRVTKVDKIEHLRASHLKPWRDSDNFERLNGENGLLLTPSIDHLFDRGFISFEDNGDLLVSPVSHKLSLEKMGVPAKTKLNVGSFSEGQKAFLDFHREDIFLQKRV